VSRLVNSSCFGGWFIRIIYNSFCYVEACIILNANANNQTQDVDTTILDSKDYKHVLYEKKKIKLPRISSN